jgi:hypothetical protein
VLQPFIGLLPDVLISAQLPAEGEQGRRDLAGTADPEPVQVRGHHAAPAARPEFERGLVPQPECNPRAELPAQDYRHRVVVTVDMGDQAAGDLGQAAADPGKCRPEQVRGPLQSPARVDQHQVVAGLDGVHVHRPQAVVRQRERDPVHAGRDCEQPGFGPVG